MYFGLRIPLYGNLYNFIVGIYNIHFENERIALTLEYDMI